jgi:hypothetical protein
MAGFPGPILTYMMNRTAKFYFVNGLIRFPLFASFVAHFICVLPNILHSQYLRVYNFCLVPVECRYFCHPENYSHSSIFSLLLPPSSYFFFFVTCFLFLFFPHYLTSLSLFLAASATFFFLFYITFPLLSPLFSFLIFVFLFSSFAFPYFLCLSLLSLR